MKIASGNVRKEGGSIFHRQKSHQSGKLFRIIGIQRGNDVVAGEKRGKVEEETNNNWH
jgi:hypothetical protein